MAEEHFDLAIVGRSVTRSGAALDAASWQLPLALLEKRDFAAGNSSTATSSRSTSDLCARPAT
jgi:glycerol-3-phosphate dehydrogenase